MAEKKVTLFKVIGACVVVPSHGTVLTLNQDALLSSEHVEQDRLDHLLSLGLIAPAGSEQAEAFSSLTTGPATAATGNGTPGKFQK